MMLNKLRVVLKPINILNNENSYSQVLKHTRSSNVLDIYQKYSRDVYVLFGSFMYLCSTDRIAYEFAYGLHN